jgi:hypothetical protein
MIYGGVSCKRTPSHLNFPHSPNPASVVLPMSQWREAPPLDVKRATPQSASASLPASQSREKIAPTSLSFSASSALFQKSAQLTENTRQTPPCNPIHFYQFRTPLHSFPGSHLFSVCSPKHTGSMGCRLLISSASRGRASRRSARTLAPSIKYNASPGNFIGSETSHRPPHQYLMRIHT